MDDWESGIRQVLDDPQQMAQIMKLAQSLMGESASGAAAEAAQAAPAGMDSAMLGKLGALLGRDAGGDARQALLQALRPYLSEKRQHKMERAIRMARLARVARLAMLSWGDGDA